MKYSDVQRMKHITKGLVSNKRCNCCGEDVLVGTMWKVNRYSTADIQSEQISTWYYCTKCCENKEEVLHEVDTDSYPYGIFPVDTEFKKKTDDWANSLTNTQLGTEEEGRILQNFNRVRVNRKIRIRTRFK